MPLKTCLRETVLPNGIRKIVNVIKSQPLKVGDSKPINERAERNFEGCIAVCF